MNTLAAVLLVLVLPHGGHVRGGQTTTIQIHPAIEETPGLLEISWQLTHHSIVLQQGRLTVPQAGATLKLDLPEVRVVTPLILHQQILSDGEELATQEAALWLHPPTLDHPSLSEVITGPVAVVTDDPSPGLETLLRDMGLEVTTFSAEDINPSALFSWIIIDGNMLDKSLERTVGRALARGARVVVWEQNDPRYTPRSVLRTVTPIKWDQDHPLLARVDPSWLEPRWVNRSAVVVARRFEGDGHIVAGWPNPESAADPAAEAKSEPTPLLDALVWIDRTTPGMRINWQLPVTDWRSDPLAAELLYNSLVYLAFPPPSETQPTSTPGATP
ncbi:hypothetical protein [Algisphaera agarilytica]|uniref:Uncharacterized protein n=1 Tax=Algisphaera agarilytica TaxID=1385975 RepID=A0A7X0H9R7_9BACT|nr:hypothetical protein [Algisphaera agarilytica]MBB6431713.1 hypothetical protein [Algisphaera agarilytica]